MHNAQCYRELEQEANLFGVCFEAEYPRNTLMQSELNNGRSPYFGNVLCIKDPKKSKSSITFSVVFYVRIFGSSFRGHQLLQAPSFFSDIFFIN
jgi:hypothetical protein